MEILAPESVRTAFSAFANARLRAVQGESDDAMDEAYIKLCQAIQQELGTPVSLDLPIK